MKALVTMLFLVLCSTVYGQGEIIRETLMHDGIRRTYNLYVPSTYSADQTWPLVVNIHGLTGSGPQQMNGSGMNAVAEREGFLVAYPSAVNGDWSASPDHNVGFFDTLLDTIESAYNVDASRVFSTGMSQGGITSYILGAERPNTFAAIASVAGSRPLATPDTLFPEFVPHIPDRPLPLLHIHGTADSIVPFDGGDVEFPQFGTVPFPSVERILSEWLANNSCQEAPAITELPDARSTDNLSVTLHSYENCSAYTGTSGAEHVAEIQFYRVNGGEHVWPSPPVLDSSTEIWDFFSRHELAASSVDGPELAAGDADQDLDFDQLDLVQVQVAAKYLTGQTATWGEGDWDAAPGGSVGSPPAGDGLFNQFDIVAAQQADIYLNGSYAAIGPNGQSNDAQASIVYHAGTGGIAVDAPAGMELTSINIDSAAGIFTGAAAQNLGGSFDNDADNNVFKATFGGSFGSLSFGNVAQAGLSEGFVLGDLSVVGSLAGGGDLGSVDLVYVPEPASALLLAVGLVIGLTRIRRAKH